MGGATFIHLRTRARDATPRFGPRAEMPPDHREGRRGRRCDVVHRPAGVVDTNKKVSEKCATQRSP